MTRKNLESLALTLQEHYRNWLARHLWIGRSNKLLMHCCVENFTSFKELGRLPLWAASSTSNGSLNRLAVESWQLSHVSDGFTELYKILQVELTLPTVCALNSAHASLLIMIQEAFSQATCIQHNLCVTYTQDRAKETIIPIGTNNIVFNTIAEE